MPRATQPERQSTGLDIIESMECSTGLTQNIVQAVCGRGSPPSSLGLLPRPAITWVSPVETTGPNGMLLG